MIRGKVVDADGRPVPGALVWPMAVDVPKGKVMPLLLQVPPRLSNAELANEKASSRHGG